MVASRIREKGLTAKVTCDPNLPRLLYGDEFHLRQILVNLLSNAVKYTPEGGIELNVSGEENYGILRLDMYVKDTGIGIKEEDLPKLFKKFSRIDLSKNGSIEGTGLGLSITKQLVELMNGTITVESEYGVGSTFTVRIPQKVASSTPIGDIKQTYLDLRGEYERYHPRFEAPEARILIVDDLSINLLVIRKLLESTRMQIDTVTSGRVCLEKICERRYDLILMDHMMPDMDGIETLKAMRTLENSLNDGVPVIMLTANAMLGAREEYIEAGFVDYLSKPVRGGRLESLILKYLPAEKVLSAPSSEGDALPKMSFSERLSVLLPELDYASGLTYCAGDEDFYRSMLDEYVSGMRDAELSDAFKAKDWNEYRISVHSLKSSSRMVGLSALSDECLLLEQAAKDGDEEYILANHAKLTAHYRAVADALSSI